MRQLPNIAIKNLKELYKEEYGRTLSDKEAIDLAHQLLRLTKTVAEGSNEKFKER